MGATLSVVGVPWLVHRALGGEVIVRRGYTRRVLWACIWIAVALLVNGLIFRWLGGFGTAGEAMERWGEHSARRWARRRGMKGF